MINRISRLGSIGLFVFLSFIKISFSQSKNNLLNGTWKAYELPSDTLEEEEGGVWMTFSDSTIISLLSFGGGQLPEQIGDEINYKIAKDSLILFEKTGINKVKLTMYTKEFIRYSYLEEGKLKFCYLRKEN